MSITKLAKGYIEVHGPKCCVCKQRHSVIVKETDLKRYESGKDSVQKCFPYLSADGRETILTGISGDCYDRYYGKEEEE